MQLADLIEKRRFVGRELLLWLWMESELFEGTLHTKVHGDPIELGFWLEKQLVLSAETESTTIKAAMPGLGREAKEALLRGQLPERVGVRIAQEEHETSLVLTGETFGVRTLKLATVLNEEEEYVGDLVDELAGRTRGRPKKKRDEDAEEDDTPFYERMAKTKDVEDLLAALYRDFLTLRLDARWETVVVPTMREWVEGRDVDADAYRAACEGKGGKKAKKPTGVERQPRA
ncbi:MAG: hypothetical protein H6722_33385 [Sandaracinus sp.]|nr:hypothetical protein [Sandaracinus sp.]MCB9617352.1 hypothetical protein [Sandaracinus sp.]